MPQPGRRQRLPLNRPVVFADSAHIVMQEQPGRCLVHLVSDALPLAQRAGDAAPGQTIR